MNKLNTQNLPDGLGLPGIVRGGILFFSLLLATTPALAVKFRLPLSSDTSVHYYYDHNTSSGITAWNCSGTSYNGHQGTDFSGGPRGRAIYAAAAGTLVYKIDGFGDGYVGSPDGGGAGNYVRLDHAGTTSWYMHMTAGSVTGKGLNSAVACGEQLGGVGTSGSSSGLHLHFDVRQGSTRLDPFIGGCGGSDFWVNQNGGSPTLTCENSAVSRWYFDGGTDGWVPVNGTTGLGWSGSGWPGIIYADQTGPDAYWHSPGTSFAAGAENSVNVDVYPQSGSSANHDMQIFWKTAQDNTWSAPKSTPVFNYVLQNNWSRINLDVGAWSGTINQLRLDFDQASSGTRWIVNHVYTQKTPKYWFGSSASGWTPGNGLSGVVWTASGWPGVIYADQTANDAYLMGPGNQDFLGGINDVIRVRVFPQNGTTANHDMKVYWTTEATGISEANSSSIINYTAKDTWIDLTIPVGHKPEWNGHFIRQLRLDLDAVNQGNRWIIDYVAISHLTTPANPPVNVADIIVDNPAATTVGTWSVGTSAADKFGADYKFKGQGTGTSYLQFTPNIATAGNYRVYEWHPQGSNRPTGAPHIVAYNGGTQTVNVNQQVGGGAWNLIGTYNFAAGTAGSISITDGFAQAGMVVMADAIKLVYAP